ncbi:putative G-protein coupled receptor 141 [Mixophyes fleayi]|uniref:putative G-protein coupled receptor 141 n=1 Tax=Mixophyes fleayi TaxID=3061075 RepID=UPI003F4DAB5B
MGTSNQTTCFIDETVANNILITLYIVVFIGGIIGNIIMVFLLCKTNTRSMTTTSIINLLVVHCVFLLTVPFRIYYYIQRQWDFSFGFCRLVSAMIHIHMYLSFIFYVALLSIKCISYLKQRDKIEFYRTLHSVVASAAVWIIILLVMLPLFFFQYGTYEQDYDSKQCFNFHKEFTKSYVIALNYVVIVVMFTIVCLLLGVQMFIIIKVVKKLKRSTLDHQEFWVQLKSLFFIFVMIICFFPYLMFRIYYIRHTEDCLFFNEIVLGITALSCLDILAFAIQTYFQKVLKNRTCSLKCLW